MAVSFARVALLVLYFCNSINALWPAPHEYSHGSRVLWLPGDLQITCDYQQTRFRDRLQAVLRPWPTSRPAFEADLCTDETLQLAVDRLTKDTVALSFVPWKFHSRNASWEPKSDARKEHIRKLAFVVRQRLNGESEEAYSLVVSEEGEVLITLNHLLGGLRALTTLTQLFYRHSGHESGVYMTNVPLVINDSPVFGHRGLNLDISRNIITPTDVIRTIDAMAFNKFNRLHLHASDAQSWPLEIPALAALARKGAYHDSQIWSVADLNEVQTFGAQKGVQVYIEIDMPGHIASAQAAYPELIISFNRKPWSEYSAQPPSGQLKLDDPDATAFITDLLQDLLPRVSPFSFLFHLGGDEITASAYNMSSSEVKPHLQSFVDFTISLLHLHAQTPVVWEEHLLDYNLTLPSDVIVQAWREGASGQPSSLAKIVAHGHKALFGSNQYWYLDCGHGVWVDPDPGNPQSPIKSPFMDYCAPLHNWREIYSYDPLSDIPDNHKHLVIGGEASMWAEQTDGVNLDNNLWPRLAAAGEVLWRGRGKVDEDVTRRLAEMREFLVKKGVMAGPVQVTWCLMNPGNCVL